MKEHRGLMLFPGDIGNSGLSDILMAQQAGMTVRTTITIQLVFAEHVSLAACALVALHV